MSARDILLELLGNKCSSCGATDNLELHHIDNNRLNNSLDNIKLVCKECHKNIHSKNMGNHFLMSVPDAMFEALERERKSRMLESIQETLRQIVSDYLRSQ